MRAFLYERVSSEEQAKHGYSLDAQNEALTQFCKEQGYVIVGVYKDEGISARKPYTKRPAMLELLHDDFKVNVQMKPKVKKENPQKYIDRLNRLNEIYIMGNIYAEDYKRQSAELQQKIAELQKITPVKTQNFSADWKEVYAMLDDEHRRSFWHGLLRGILPSVENATFELLY